MLQVAPIANVKATEDVDLALVLVTDVSRSIDDTEFTLEKDGYAAAFTNDRVISAIKSGPLGAIAVSYVEFASGFEVKTVIDWAVIRDLALGQGLRRQTKRRARGHAWGRTAISARDRSCGRHAGRERLRCDPPGDRRLRRRHQQRREEVSSGTATTRSRRASRSTAQAIINEHPVSWTFAHVQPPGGLQNYYKENVTGGPGSFVLEIRDFHTFADAMTPEADRRDRRPTGPDRGSRVTGRGATPLNHSSHQQAKIGGFGQCSEFIRAQAHAVSVSVAVTLLLLTGADATASDRCPEGSRQTEQRPPKDPRILQATGRRRA